MKRIVKLLLIIVIGLLITACDDGYMPKTQYEMYETAVIDDIEITMMNATYNNDILEVEYKITNNRSNTISIDADTYFKLYDINMVQIPNTYENDVNIIKSNETITYTLQYNVQEKSIYEILFYSGIVENNIKFVINK